MRVRLLLLGLLVATVAPPSYAQEPALAEDREALGACLADAGDERDCIGAVSDPCQEEPDDSTTIGMADCLSREQRAWDAVLNERYRDEVAAANETDERLEAEMGLEPDVHDSLRAAQRAWIAFRDAECTRLYNAHKDGTIRTIIGASCLRDLTAERAIAISSSLE